MKKLLGILLTTVMLLTSMGVLAMGGTDNVLLDYGFESEDDTKLGGSLLKDFTGSKGTVTVLDSTVNTDESVKPISGTKYLKLQNSTTTRVSVSVDSSKMPVLEARTQYRFSCLWHGGGTFKHPALSLNGPVLMHNYTRANFVFPAADASTSVPAPTDWIRYEVYFVTDDVVPDNHKLSVSLYFFSGTEYYDDFKLEKVENASIRFIEGKALVTGEGVQAGYTGTALGDSQRLKYFNSKNTYTFYEEDGNKNPEIWGAMSAGIEAKTCVTDETYISVVSHYFPKKLGETAVMMVGIYKDVNGKSVLQKVQIGSGTNYKYDIIDVAKTKTKEAHQRMHFGFNTIQVQKTDLTQGCYIKAFMINNLTELDSISEIATLPAAQ